MLLPFSNSRIFLTLLWHLSIARYFSTSWSLVKLFLRQNTTSKHAYATFRINLFTRQIAERRQYCKHNFADLSICTSYFKQLLSTVEKHLFFLSLLIHELYFETISGVYGDHLNSIYESWQSWGTMNKLKLVILFHVQHWYVSVIYKNNSREDTSNNDDPSKVSLLISKREWR